MRNNNTHDMHSPPLHCIIQRATTAPGAPKKRKRDENDNVPRRLRLLEPPPESMSDLEI